ncbi:hypothetical protein GmHk_13G036284 [Glycine max]|nr:hypothetical protein GmHk_13G036284 [Glycine max]
MPPLDSQSCGRPPTTTRNYVFTVDVTDDIISKPTPLVRPYAYHELVLLPTEAVHFVDASTPFMTVQHSSGVRDIWTISMHNGEQHVDDPWNRLLTDNDLMGGDEVIFYYRPNEHNYIQVPLNYHINWYPKYSTYVVLNVNGDNSYFVRVRRYENKIYFADGIKEFRSAMKLYENMVIRFSATDKNTTFHVSFSTPTYRQLSATSPATTRRHVFTVDVDEDMLQQKKPLVGAATGGFEICQI